MYMNSPAKHERIERHLMRQRGAGVRTISASFGFSFASSAPAPIEDTFAEPQLKRRKTSFETVTLATLPDSDRNGVHGGVSEQTRSKPNKRRKRLNVAQENEPDRLATLSNGDDSFIAVLGKADRKAVSRTSRKETARTGAVTITDVPGGADVAATRSSERTVTGAKVQTREHCAKEQAPVVKKKYTQKPKIVSTGSRLDEDKGSIQSHDSKKSLPAWLAEEPRSKQKDPGLKASSRSSTRRAKCPEPTAVMRRTDTEAQDEGDGSLIKDAIVAPSKIAGQKMQLVDEDELAGIEGMVQRQPSTTTAYRRTIRQKAKPVSAETKPRPPVTRQTRSPLRPADGNIVRRAVSRVRIVDDEFGQGKGILNNQSPVEPKQIPVQGATTQQKQRVVDDETNNGRKKVSKVPQNVRPTQAPARDDDIDWLFECNPSTRPMVTSSKPMKPASKPRTKIADIDMDDLLSNIASFATASQANMDHTATSMNGLAPKRTRVSRRKSIVAALQHGT